MNPIHPPALESGHDPLKARRNTEHRPYAPKSPTGAARRDLTGFADSPLKVFPVRTVIPNKAANSYSAANFGIGPVPYSEN